MALLQHERGAAPAVPRPQSPPPRRRRRISLTPYFFLLPGVLLFGLFILYPIAQAVQISFYDWNILRGAASEFIGLDNYLRAMQDDRFWLSLGNSGIYMLFTVPPQIVLGLAVAMLLRSKAPAQPLFRVLYYLPVATSWVVVSLLVVLPPERGPGRGSAPA